MESKAKGGLRARKTLRKVFASLLILSFLLILAVYFFIKSSYPAPLITYAARRVTGMDVEISALTAGPWLKLSFKGIKVGRGEETLLSADRLEIVVTLKGLTSGRVVNLFAGNPVLFLSALPASSGEVNPARGGLPIIAIPWFFNELTIRDGLIRQSDTGSSPLVGPINLHVTARHGTRAGLEAEAYLPLLKTSASINAEVDIKELGLAKGHVSLGLIKLQDMGAGGLSIIRGGQGSVKADFTLERRDASLRAAMKLEFKDVTLPTLPKMAPASGKLTGSVALNNTFTTAELRGGLFLKEPGAGRAAYRALFIKGDYDIGKKALNITKASLAIPSLGAIHLKGVLYGLPESLVSADISVRAERVSLALLNEALFGPLSMEISGPEGGGLTGRLNVKGSVSEGLKWNMALTLADSVRYGAYALNLFETPLKVSAEGVYSSSDDRLKVGSLRAELGSAGPLTMKGTLRGLASGKPLMDMRLRGSAIDLPGLKKALSGPLLSDVALKGEAGAVLSIKGGLFDPRISGEANFENMTFTGRGLALRRLRADLDFGYDKKGLSVDNLSLKSGSIGLKGSGPLPKLLNAGGTIGSITYDGKLLRAENINFKADKAFIAGTSVEAGKASGGPLPRLVRSGLSIRSVTYDGKLLRAGGVRLKADKAFFVSSGTKGGKPWGGPLPKLLKTDVAFGSITYDGELLRAGGMNLKVNKAIFPAKGRPLFEGQNLTLSGALTFEVSKWLFRASRLDFSARQGAEGTGVIKGEVSGASLDLAGPVRAGAVIILPDLSLERLRPLLAEFTDIGVSVEASGLIDARFIVSMAAGETETSLKSRVKLGLRDGAFASADGSIAAEGLRLKVDGDLKLLIPSMKADFTMRAVADGFELLAGSFYGSFKDRPVKVSARGSYDLYKDELRLPSLEVSLLPVGSLKVSADILSLTTGPRFESLSVSADISNKEFYDFFLRDTLGESMPMLAALDVAGRARLALRADGTLEQLNLRGELQMRQTGLSQRGGGFFVRGMELRLPIELEYPGTTGRERRGGGKRARRGTGGFGSLSVNEISLGPVDITALKASPAIAGNALVFGGDVVLPIFGGTVTLGDIVFKDILSPDRELGLQIEVAGIDLKRTSIALGLPPFDGSLSGSIPNVRLAAGNLTTKGQIKLRLFDGEVLLTHMAVGQVFSPVPSFKSSIEIREINLGRLTSAFDFGSITGVLEGRVKNLIVVKGQPESFFMDIRTVKKSGVSQRINTRALENVSILGTGAVGSILNRGIYRLFDEYRYSKMGFQAQLKNDELLLLGIETQGDKGYIIKGAKFPPKVEVVSYTQRISFKEMMKRLSRVDFSASPDTVVK